MSQSIAEFGFRISDLEPIHRPLADKGASSAAPGDVNSLFTDDESTPGARVVGSARGKFPAKMRNGEAEICEAAKPLVIREILELLSGDLKDPRAHERYLQSLNFKQLDARRAQLKEERQLQFHFNAAAQRRIKR